MRMRILVLYIRCYFIRIRQLCGSKKKEELPRDSEYRKAEYIELWLPR